MDKQIKLSFSSVVQPIRSDQKLKLTKASLEDLQQYIPDIDKKNIDLLPIAFNAFVANRFNNNGDGIDGDSALAIANLFINKPINVEHDRKSIVGVITSATYSEFGTDKPLKEKDLKGSSVPFNVTLGGVLWKVVSSKITDMVLESNDKDSDYYQKVHASWEVGFTNYELVLIKGDSRNLADQTMRITTAEEIEKLEKHLLSEGGTGKTDETTHIYRLVHSDGSLPLGIGLTENPAADVNGVAAKSYSENDDESEEEGKEGEASIEGDKSHNISIQILTPTWTEAMRDIVVEAIRNELKANSLDHNDLNKNNSSLSQKINVKSNSSNNSTMKIKNLTDITDELLKEAKASEITDFISEEIRKKSEEYDKAQKDKDQALANANKKATDLEASQEKTNQELANVKKELETLRKAQADKEKAEVFSSRMAALDEQYDLTKEDREIIAKNIRDLDEQSYDVYAKDLSILLNNRVKANKEQDKTATETKEEDKEVKEAKASQEEEKVSEAIDKSEKESDGVANAAAHEDLRTKYAKAFSIEGFQIVR